MTPEEKRRRRLEELANKLKKAQLSDHDKVIGWGCFRWGCRGERVEEYLSVLRMAGMIKIEGDLIKWL